MKVSAAVTWWFNQNRRGPLKVGVVKQTPLSKILDPPLGSELQTKL